MTVESTPNTQHATNVTDTSLSDIDAKTLFLVGAFRSGTTMLRLMLKHHPEIIGGEEFEYAFKFMDGNAFPDIASAKKQLAHDRMFQDSGLTIDSSPDYPSLVRSFMEQRRAGRNDKIILSVVHGRIDAITALWPHARFIHLVRDPRDVARSCVSMGWAGNVYYGANYWLDAEKRWEQLVDQFKPDQWMELRYEDLLENVEASLQQICEFVGVAFDERMFDYIDNSTYGAPDKSLAWQWKRKLTPKEIDWVEVRCGDMMEQRGYQRVGTSKPLSMLTCLRLYIHNRIKRIQFNIKRYGLKLYCCHHIAKRIDSRWSQSIHNRILDIQRKHLK